VTAGRGSPNVTDPHNERHGIWLGTTNHRVGDVVARRS
jgi:hypothetical protein